MSQYVVDASVAAKWLIPEEDSDIAERLLIEVESLIAPDFLRVELANIIASKIRREQLSVEQARISYGDSIALPLQFHADTALLDSAYTLATIMGISVYDALYSALAIREACQLVTADRQLYDAMVAANPANVLWIGDIPEALEQEAQEPES